MSIVWNTKGVFTQHNNSAEEVIINHAHSIEKGTEARSTDIPRVKQFCRDHMGIKIWVPSQF